MRHDNTAAWLIGFLGNLFTILAIIVFQFITDFFTKKCLIIWSVVRKAVLLQPLLREIE
jgi:hypothetical protein